MLVMKIEGSPLPLGVGQRSSSLPRCCWASTTGRYRSSISHSSMIAAVLAAMAEALPWGPSLRLATMPFRCSQGGEGSSAPCPMG